MTFNWTYFPLEADGLAAGVQNPLPPPTTQTGDPWAAGDGWFTGDGASTSLVTPWSEDQAAFDNVALPRSGSFLIGLQIDISVPPAAGETVMFCGYSDGSGRDGLKILLQSDLKLRLEFSRRGQSTVAVSAGALPTGTTNVFCYADHRPAGQGTDAAFSHLYIDGTDRKATSWIYSLAGLGEIYPQDIDDNTVLCLGANAVGGVPQPGSHFSGRMRRLHLCHFGTIPDLEPGNLAEFMNLLSIASMVPTPELLSIMEFTPGSRGMRVVERASGRSL